MKTGSTKLLNDWSLRSVGIIPKNPFRVLQEAHYASDLKTNHGSALGVRNHNSTENHTVYTDTACR